MSTWCRVVVSMCLVAEMEVLSAGEMGTTGRIVFSGAVVVPTCAVTSEPVADGASWQACRPGRRSPSAAVRANPVAVRVWRRTLDAAQASRLPVVAWRSRRTKQAQVSGLVVETRVYQ